MASEMRKSYIDIDRCRICGNGDLVPILSLDTQYLTGVFPSKVDCTLTHGPLELVHCNQSEHLEHCGLVQLRQSYDLNEMYGEHYGYRSSLNRSMAEHLKELVQGLLKMVPVSPEDVILDIGSNDGTLLSYYPEKGPLLVGMDPTAKKFGKFYKPHIRQVTDFFSADRFKSFCGERKAKIVTSIAMFYDLEDPQGFMRQVYEILADDGVWLFEQSYLPSMLSSNAYDTICHEHLEYYALRQIKFMTDRAGLKILDVGFNDINGGSFAVTVAKKASPFKWNTSEVDKILRTEDFLNSPEPYILFKERIFKHREQLLNMIHAIKQKGEIILGYGASTKGNVILQFCGITEKEIGGIAEINDEKFGRLTPGTWIPIISEAEAHSMNPDYFLIMPWHFRKDFLRREVNYLKSGGRMIFPLPVIEVISK